MTPSIAPRAEKSTLTCEACRSRFGGVECALLSELRAKRPRQIVHLVDRLHAFAADSRRLGDRILPRHHVHGIVVVVEGVAGDYHVRRASSAPFGKPAFDVVSSSGHKRVPPEAQFAAKPRAFRA